MCVFQKRISTLVFNPTVLREAKIVYDFGLSECNRVKESVRIRW